MKKRPNIIFYFSDQQRWDTMGCYGQKLDVTPNLDRLAKQGTKFEYAFTAQPVCGPTRASLQAGKYATEVGCHTNNIALREDENTVAKYFNEAGYDTAYIGKWHLASDDERHMHFERAAVPERLRGGYKYWMASDVLEFTSHGYNGYVHDTENRRVDFIGYRADAINNFAIEYLHNREGDKPFFMFISQIEPHQQNDMRRFEGPDGSKKKFKDYEVPKDLEGRKGNYRRSYPDYLGCCNSLDYNVGRLIDTLEDMGILEDTIIIYTADHGCHFQTRNGEYKRSCHESSIRIPMIAYGKEFNGGKVVKELVSLIDIPTTLLDCAEIDKPDDYRGNSLKKLVRGEEVEWPKEIFVQISESQVGRAIRTDKWKYSVRANAHPRNDATAETYYEEFLYNLENDYEEKNNLVENEEYKQIREELSKIMKGKILEVENIAVQILPYKDRVGF